MSASPAQARERRTVTITGHPDRLPPPRATRAAGDAPRGVVYTLPVRGPRPVQAPRRRPARTPAERLGPRPDRLAMWAVIMALFLIAVTIASSSG